MNNLYAQTVINDIYAEGDIDFLFFSFLAGPVGYDDNDNSYGKSDLQQFEDTLQLVEYLVRTGDFIAGRMFESSEKPKFVRYPGGFSDFSADARMYMRNEGLRCDALLWGLTLKKNEIGKSAPTIPDSIGRLFQTPV